MGKGGGGSQGSGRVEYPPYLTNIHNHMLYGKDLSNEHLPYDRQPDSTSVLGLINSRLSLTAWDGNSPISNVISGLAGGSIHSSVSLSDGGFGLYVTLPDPSAFFISVDDAMDAFSTAVGNMSTTTANLDALQSALETATEAPYYRGLNNFVSGMSDINATNSSAFIVGLALMESGRQRAIAEQRAQWQQQNNNSQVSAYGQLAQMELEVQKTKLVAEYDKVNTHVTYRRQAQLWDLELYEYGANMLAASSGAVSSKGQSGSTVQSVLAGALTGAAGGAAIGSMFAAEGSTGLAAVGGPWALGLGALIGGISGLFD